MTERGLQTPLTPRNADGPQAGMDAGSAPKTRPGTEPDGPGTDRNVENRSGAPATLSDRYGAGVDNAGVREGGIVHRLNVKADMLTMGEKIAWGSDSAIMREAAAEIEKLRKALHQAETAMSSMLVGIGVHNERMVGKTALPIDGPVVAALREAARQAGVTLKEPAALSKATPQGGEDER